MTQVTWRAPDELVARVRRAAGVHGLRAYDAFQLASAMAAADAIPDCRTVAAFRARSAPRPPRKASR